MGIFDHFDIIRIINLPHRADRRREMDRELERVGLLGDPRVAYHPAARMADKGQFDSIGAHGCYLSHKAVLAEAAAAGKSLLLLEDDCDFVPGAETYRTTTDWDIFYGGYVAKDPGNLLTSGIAGAHMMGFSPRAAQLVTDYLAALKVGQGEHPPIDGAYVWFRRAHPDVPTEFAKPPIGIQRSSRSDIASLKWFDRTPGISTMASALRQARNLMK